MSTLTPGSLATLEARVTRALDAADPGDLEVLGYGEISSVIAWEEGGQRYACKRLPPFSGQRILEQYVRASEAYLERLGELGVDVVPTEVLTLDGPDGTIVAYCVQPALAPETLAPHHVARLDEAAFMAALERIIAAIVGTAGPRLGLDGQLSNWAFVGDDLRYVDVSTPMMRDADGGEALDPDLFLASLPWLLRPAVKRWMLGAILDKYYQRRGVLLDLLGNMVKERLDDHLPALLSVCNAALDEPITEPEVRRYYRSDARMWELLQRLRRADRAWQRRVRRRVYPFLLPGPIAR